MSHPDSLNGLRITTDKQELDVPLIQAFLARSYWARGISIDKVKTAIQHSLCFGVFDGQKQVGFARVVTDFSRIAYLADVFVLEPYRARGVGTWLLSYIVEHPDLCQVSRWFLMTADAHRFYEKFGFRSPKRPERYMELDRSAPG